MFAPLSTMLKQTARLAVAAVRPAMWQGEQPCDSNYRHGILPEGQFST